jgi:hypothetical protein
MAPSSPCAEFRASVAYRATGAVSRVSRGVAGAETNEQSTRPHISGDGRFVAFNAWGPPVAGDTNEVDDIYVRGPLR